MIVNRQETLRLDSADRPVEVAAVRIDLSGPVAPQNQIAGKEGKPLTAILNALDVPQESHASRSFRIQADALIVKCFAQASPQTLDGHCNTPSYKCGEILADVVEALPPLSVWERSRAGGPLSDKSFSLG